MTPPDLTPEHLAVLDDEKRAAVAAARKALAAHWKGWRHAAIDRVAADHIIRMSPLATLRLLHALAEARLVLRTARPVVLEQAHLGGCCDCAACTAATAINAALARGGR